MPEPITVLIVDDSRLFRAALEESLRGEADLEVVGSVFSGAKALEFIRAKRPDVVTLDVEMPGMDGLATLEQIQQLNAGRPADEAIGIIMVSAFTRRGADVTVKALEAGAFDFVTKPSGPSQEVNLATLRDELVGKIRACARRYRRSASAATAVTPPPVPRLSPAPPGRRAGGIRAVVIGVSTGGPRALSTLLPELCNLLDLPVLIVQHMPPDFTRSLAESLSRQTGRTVIEAGDGMPLQNGCVYIAPGGRHLVLRGSAAAPIAGVTDQPPENGCRPSADVLFRSAAAVLRSEVVALILTGMGRDGTAGLGAIRRGGGHIIAQDEATSVVWGMPGSAVEEGLADQVLPLDQIARAVADVASRGGSGA